MASEQTPAPQAPLTWTVSEDDERLDQHIKARHPSLSRQVIKQLSQRGLLLCNDRPTKPHQRLRPGDILCLPDGLPSITPTPRPDLPLTILYQDRQLLFVKKPHGLPCHPLDPWEEDSVCHRALARCPDLEGVGEDRAPGLLHRLDNDSAGVLCFARDQETYDALIKARGSLAWEKWYLGWCHGELHEPTVIRHPIAHHPNNKQKMVVLAPDAPGKPRHRGNPRQATTHVFPIQVPEDPFPEGWEQYTGATPVMLHIDVGVRHQIRAHLASIGHPLLGDTLYDPETSFAQLHLHAWQLRLPSPPLPYAISVRLMPDFLMPPLPRRYDIT